MNGSAIFVFQGNREKSYATITLQITELICLFFFCVWFNNNAVRNKTFEYGHFLPLWNITSQFGVSVLFQLVLYLFSWRIFNLQTFSTKPRAANTAYWEKKLFFAYVGFYLFIYLFQNC